MSNTNKFITHIRDLIGKDDFKTAIQQLSVLLKDSPFLDEAVQQSARYSNVMQQIRLGLVDYEAADIAQNQIRYGILELLREIEEQEQSKPSVKAEVERYTVKFEKNMLHNSTINAGGNVTIGDTIVHSESDTSRRLRLFLYAFVPILALVVAFGYTQYQKLQEPLTLTVFLKDVMPNPAVPLKLANVTLIYGDKKESQAVENEATFKGIPPNFRDKNVVVQVHADGFMSVSQSFVLSEKTLTIPLSKDGSLSKVLGIIKDENNNPVAGVHVSVLDATVTSDSLGHFVLPMPFDKQRPSQRVQAFKKGYKLFDVETPIIPNEPVQIILKK